MKFRKAPRQAFRNRRDFLRHSLKAASGVALAQLVPQAGFAQDRALTKIPELRHRNGVLNAVIQVSDADRNVPSAGKSLHLRAFQGWYLGDTSSTAVPSLADVMPGPTLRTRVGGRVNIMLLNRINDSNFSYTQPNGCDAGVNYPFNDTFPNCFHGSSTSNLHFHGTHTNPDGLGDNVLVQVIPNDKTSQEEWNAIFRKIFTAPVPPTSWGTMPVEYQVKQLGYTIQQFRDAQKSGVVLPPKGLVADYDREQAELAKKEGRPVPSSLWEYDRDQVLGGQWPQYIIGAFPNSFFLPAFTPGRFQAGQAPGTHWYHAHKHGSTSLHIFNGLAGVFIVEGDYDDKIRAFFQRQLPPTAKFTEQVIVFQQILVSQNLVRAIKPAQGGGPTGDNANTGANQKLVNGKISPIVTMKPGEIQLWRLLNACGGGGKGTIDPTMFVIMQANGFEFRQVAMDGVQFSWENYLAQPFRVGDNAVGGLTLAGGNRADILVKAPTTPGTYNLLVPNDLNNVKGAQSLLMQVQVEESPALKMNFFSGTDRLLYPPLPPFLQNLPAPSAPPREVKFTMSAGGGLGPNPPGFFINGKKFEESAEIEFCMRRNEVEDWILTNDNNGAAHPFHIHINPFQVLQVNGPTASCAAGAPSCDSRPPSAPPCFCTPQNRLGSPIWQDVIAIPPGGSVRIRHKFADFTGTYVLHCHILAHEDRGMMRLVRVIPDGKNIDKEKACNAGKVAHH